MSVGMPLTGCAAMTALACVVFSFAAYFGLERNVMSPELAASMPRTPEMSMSGSCEMEHSSASASSRSFIQGAPRLQLYTFEFCRESSCKPRWRVQEQSDRLKPVPPSYIPGFARNGRSRVAGLFRCRLGGGIGRPLGVVELHRHQLGNSRFLHGNPVHGLCGFHRFL